MLNLKITFIPRWALLFSILAWFSAEITTFSTVVSQINLGTFIFSISFYLVQTALVADIILRRHLSLLGIFLIGFIYGLLEEAIYIKNPLPLPLLYALGHSAITITFPYLTINFLIPGRKEPFLSKAGYFIAVAYLLFLYIFMGFVLPFVYLNSLLVSLGTILLSLIFLLKFGQKEFISDSSKGVSLWEKAGIIILAAGGTILTKQNYLGITTIFLWTLIRQKMMVKKDFYFAVILYGVFNFLLSFINNSADKTKIAVNYPFALIVGLVLISMLGRRMLKDYSFLKMRLK